VAVDTDVDPLDSVVVVVDPGDGTYVVSVIPYDDFGNFIGPGFADSVTVNTIGILVPSSSVDDDLDGSYTHNLGGDQFALRHDPAVVSILSLEWALPIQKDCLGVEHDDGEGKLNIALACSSGHSGSPLELVSVTLKTDKNAKVDSFFLKIEDVLLGSDDAPPMTIPGVGESVCIGILEGICGDANGDGEVNILDVIIDLKLSGGGTPNESQRIMADLNRDGKVNVLDAVITFQHIVGLASINGCDVTDTQSIGTVVITK